MKQTKINSFKKIIPILFMSLTMMALIIFSPLSEEKASAASPVTKTLSYGNYTYENSKYYTWMSYNHPPGMSMKTYYTVSDKGVTINSITQNVVSYPYMITISSAGKEIIYKTSANANQKAISYAKFSVKVGLPYIGGIRNGNVELKTSFKVTKIDKSKKKVTVEIQNTSN